MRRILLSCALLGVLTLPAAAVARSSAPAKPGYLVVRKAAGDGGVNGRPVVTLVVRGFVLGRVSREARVAVYYLPLKNAGGVPQVQQGADVSTSTRQWHGLPGKVFLGSNFRFRAMGGRYRVVVRGSGCTSSPAATAMSRSAAPLSTHVPTGGTPWTQASSARCRRDTYSGSSAEADGWRVTSRRSSWSRTSRRLRRSSPPTSARTASPCR
jgi:hypothetical protein